MTAPGCLAAPFFGGVFPAGAVDFDGTNDYLTRGAGLTGAADSKLFTYVQWFRMDAAGSNRNLLATGIIAGGAAVDVLTWNASDNLDIIWRDPALGVLLSATTTGGVFTASASWKCLMLSIDLANTSNRQVYLGDTALGVTWTTYTNTAMDMTRADWSLGAGPDGAGKISACLGPTWFTPGVQLDFSSEAVRRKFFKSSGKPEDLGPTGALPTGTAPLIYLHILPTASAASFATNLGSGGNFTITGSLDLASTFPSG